MAGQWVTTFNPDGTSTRTWKEAPAGYDLFGNQTAAPLAPMSVPTPALPAFTPLAPTPTPQFDPLLSTKGIYDQGQAAIDAARAPLTDAVNAIVAPQIPLLTQQVQDQENVDRSSAQSTFGARGLTGSSTEIQTLTRDIPAMAHKALAEGTVKLLTAAYPIAAADKAAIVDATFKSASLSTQLRSLVGDEAFKKLSLDQQRELANQDVQLKLSLADTEMKFQASMKEAEFAFQHAENEADRQIQRQQIQYLQDERKKAREGAFIKSLTTLVGIGVGVGLGATGAIGPMAMAGGAVVPGWAVGGAAGMIGGNVGGDAFSNLFLMD